MKAFLSKARIPTAMHWGTEEILKIPNTEISVTSYELPKHTTKGEGKVWGMGCITESERDSRPDVYVYPAVLIFVSSLHEHAHNTASNSCQLIHFFNSKHKLCKSVMALKVFFLFFIGSSSGSGNNNWTAMVTEVIFWHNESWKLSVEYKALYTNAGSK